MNKREASSSLSVSLLSVWSASSIPHVPLKLLNTAQPELDERMAPSIPGNCHHDILHNDAVTFA